MWKEEEDSSASAPTALGEVQAARVLKLAVACPFCMIMLTDAAKADGEQVKVVDVSGARR